MKILRCKVNVANIMKMPDHKSELHTQIFYGDFAALAGHSGSQWIKIETDDQQTSGWVLQSQCDEVTQDRIPSTKHILFGHHGQINLRSATIPLLSGTFVENVADLSLLQDTALLPTDKLTFDDGYKMKVLNSFLHAPYLWGGCSIYGIDCSGLSKMFYRFFNLPLPHLASAQMEMGVVLDFLSNAVCGDLAFFENDQGEINHVGILLNDHEIIHASEGNGRVTTDLIDHQGIISKTSGKRTHQLRLIKRLNEISQ